MLDRTFPSRETVLSEVSYDPLTGEFYRISGRCKQGTVDSGNGYRFVRIQGRYFYAHRIAWLIIHGEMANLPLDHMNGDRCDNRIENLRLATISQNAQNKRIARTNKCGVKGVSFDVKRNRYCAYIHVNGKQTMLGRFKTLQEAASAYQQAASKNFGIYARTT